MCLVCVFEDLRKNLINDLFLLMTLCVTLTHTHIIQRIPTHTMMTPWTGATLSMRV